MPPAALYDTSVVIDVEKVDLGVYVDGAVVVSAITVGELAYGIGAGDRDARELRLRRVLNSYEIVPFDVEEAKFYGVLAEMVRSAGPQSPAASARPADRGDGGGGAPAAADHEPGRLPGRRTAGGRGGDPARWLTSLHVRGLIA